MAFGRARWGHTRGGKAETPAKASDHQRPQTNLSEVAIKGYGKIFSEVTIKGIETNQTNYHQRYHGLKPHKFDTKQTSES